jgi:type I restriction enzyme M protein
VTKSKGLERAKVDVVLDRLLEKDNETVAYASDANVNNRLIAEFLTRWVHEPWCLHGAKTGCEINFNRVFPKQSEVRASAAILKEIDAIEAEMAQLEAEIASGLKGL